MREIKPCPDQEWKQLPTEELDHILQTELEKDRPNEDVVLPILRILEEREKDYPVEKTPEVLAMLEKLSEHETPSKQSKSRRSWVAGIAAVAAVACIIVMALPRTVGAESIFDVLFRWTSGIFEFFSPEQDETNPPVEYLFETDNAGLQQLYDKVTEQGVTESVVPMWLPEEVELLGIKEIALRDGGCKVDSVFKRNDEFISISYKISSDITTQYEKKDNTLGVFDSGGISHFILENDEYLTVTWTLTGVECSMNANVAKEDIYTIIKSIYRRPIE